jgi:hypothetical protein
MGVGEKERDRGCPQASTPPSIAPPVNAKLETNGDWNALYVSELRERVEKTHSIPARDSFVVKAL